MIIEFMNTYLKIIVFNLCVKVNGWMHEEETDVEGVWYEVFFLKCGQNKTRQIPAISVPSTAGLLQERACNKPNELLLNAYILVILNA